MGEEDPPIVATAPIKEEKQTPPNMYGLSFFDDEMRSSRKQILHTFVLPLLYTSLLMWVCMSLNWGSLYTNNNLTKLKVAVVDLDGGFLGEQIVQSVRNATSATGNHLDWVIDDRFKSDAESRQAVLDERVWAVLQVSQNASASLDAALRNGDATYNPLAAAVVYVAMARNQITVGSKVVPAILAVLNPALGKAGAIHTAKFLGSVTTEPDALRAALRCPQGLASPFGFSQIDLRPFDSAPATGSTMVGMVFLLTFAFSIFQFLRVTGLVVGLRMKARDAIIFRTVTALFAYFLISLWYTLINLAFGIPLSRFYGKGGFMIYWMLNWFTMAAVGLPMESIFTFIGLEWAGYFLSFWIIVNVSGSFTSFELMPGFFKYGYGFPFFNSIQGARTIIFGTKNHLGRNFGVLLAWMVIGAVGAAFMTRWKLARNLRKGTHEL